MLDGFTTKELAILGEVIREYLTELRAEIDETEEAYRHNLKAKEENLSGILARLERSKVMLLN